MRRFLENRGTASLVLSSAIGASFVAARPFPAVDAVLSLLLNEKPHVFYFLSLTYHVLSFTTPYLLCSVLFSALYLFRGRERSSAISPVLPPYPDPAKRDKLFVVIGEQHQLRAVGPVERPEWLVIPERGLYTGIAIIGAIGSGKTAGCMYPIGEQIFGFRPSDEEKKIGGLVLEAKGDFCKKVKAILDRYGRGNDYMEVNFTTGYCYNPLHNDLEPYALAYGIATLLNSLFGKGREPFWQQAYTNMVKFIILIHKLLYGYVTLFDVYESAIDPPLLERRIKEGEVIFEDRKTVVVDVEGYLQHKDLARFQWSKNESTGQMQAALSDDLARVLKDEKVSHSIKVEPAPNVSADQKAQYQAVKRWFHNDWMRIEQRLRTSIVEGISFFLSLFDDNPEMKRVFCPPKECYQRGYDGQQGIALPPFSELIEKGVVVALNFPVSSNPGLARLLGTLMKLDFQRAMLGRIPQMEKNPDRYYRQVFFMCDEYHTFATTGESDPTGDEKFFALSRQAKCIPIVATQSISSLRSTLAGETWRTLLQTFRTKIFLALADDFSARVASDLCGKDEQLKLTYNLSESGQDANVSLWTGRATAHRASISASKSYSIHRDYVLEPKAFMELRNAQAIILGYDGSNPISARYCYLKPYYLDRNTSYFEQLAKGDL